ncbi:MAG: flagellar biosynthetic protein FliO [Candidatus Melainabacteria bacterium]
MTMTSRNAWMRLLLLAVTAGTLIPLVAVHAEEKAVSIARDFEDNVMVTIDPAVMPDLKIRRQKGRMTIVLPEQAATQGKLSVEPILEKAQLVNVQHRNHQKIITIDSDQVYVGIRPGNRSPLQLSPRPAVTAARPQETTLIGPTPAEASSPRKILPPLDTPPSQSVGATPQTVVPAKPTLRRRVSPPVVRRYMPVRSAGTYYRAPAPRRPISTVAVKPAPAVPATPAVTADTTPASVAVAPEDAPMPTPAVLTPEAPRAQDFGVDEYNVPLNRIAEAQQKSGEASLSMLWRVLGGLALVLVLVVSSLRYGLPWLLARFPALAELGREKQAEKTGQTYLKEKKTALGSKKASAAASVQSSVRAAAKPDEALPETDAMRRLKADDATATHQQPSAMARAAIAGIAGTQDFNIVSKGKLGKEKDLYLVEIGERQLVIATTPYSVSLITELDADGVPVPRRGAAAPQENTPRMTPVSVRPTATAEATGDATDKPTPPLVALLGKVNRADAPPPTTRESGFFRGRMAPVSMPKPFEEDAAETGLERLPDYEDIYPAG